MASIFTLFNITYHELPYKLYMCTHMWKWKTTIQPIGKYIQVSDLSVLGYLY